MEEDLKHASRDSLVTKEGYKIVEQHEYRKGVIR